MSKGLKYQIKVDFKVDGAVDKNDVVGAVFGQTEGLFAPKLDLRELQKKGRIGRIEVKSSTEDSATVGSIQIPSGLSRTLTAIIAASVESIDKVGPYAAQFTLKEIEDTRKAKRIRIIDRAKEIIRQWSLAEVPSYEQLESQVEKAAVHPEVAPFGSEGLSSGPSVASSDSIIIVEGRADVIRLLSSGINNVIALNGISVPRTIVKLCEEKEATAFVDGDRGGGFVLKELLKEAHVDYVVRAPKDREVEELSAMVIKDLLKRPTPADTVRRKLGLKLDKDEKVEEKCEELLPQLKGTLESRILGEDLNTVGSCPVSELARRLPKISGAYAVIFDGVVTQRLADLAKELGVRYLCGVRVKVEKTDPRVRIIKLGAQKE